MRAALRAFKERLCRVSIELAVLESGRGPLMRRLRRIAPDISAQEESEKAWFNDFWELKRRHLQAFQVALARKAVASLPAGPITVVDIGDSAGTHMLYLRALAGDGREIDTISVNLDPRAIEKIQAAGLKAVLCRAEELDLGDKPIDLFTSFEMIEHLHNPALFLRRLAKRSPCPRLVATVPFMRASRVGLYRVRNENTEPVHAEAEHIFELSPADWTLLMRHAGWRVVHEELCLQYPLLARPLLGPFWRRVDFEGFWGVILEKDPAFADAYLDWAE